MELSIPVKALVVSWLIFCFGLLPLVAQDQQQIDLSHLDTFSPDRHTAETFLVELKKLHKQIVGQEAIDALSRLDYCLDSIDTHLDVNDETMRVIYMFHANAWKKLTGYSSKTADMLMKAHKYLPLHSIVIDKNLWFVENRLGIFFNIVNDHDRSLYYYQLVADGLRSQNSPRLCRVISNMARLKITMNDAHGALDLANEGLRESLKVSNRRAEFTNRLHILSAYILQRNFDAAQQQMDSILSLYGRDSSISHRSGILEIEANLANQKGNLVKAVKLYQELIRICHEDERCPEDRYHAKRYFMLGEVALQTGDLHTCAYALNKGFDILLDNRHPLQIPVDSLKNENTFVQLYNLLGKYQLALFRVDGNETRLDSSRLAMDRAFYVFDQIVGSVPNELAKYIIAHNNKDVANTCIDLCHVLQEVGKPLADEEVIFYIEKSNSQIFDELLAQKATYSKLSSSEKIRLGELDKHLAFSRIRAKKSTAELESNLSMFEERDSILRPRLLELSRIETPVIYFIIGDRSIYSIHSFQHQLSITKLGSAEEILAQVREFIQLIAQGESESQIKLTGSIVYDKLFKGIAEVPRKFSVIAEGLLSQLPFEALVDDAGRYLIHNYEITHRISQRYINHAFEIDTVHVISPTYTSSSDLVPLRFSETEVEYIKASFDAVHVSPAISLTDLESSLQHGGILHYTGHAQSEGFQGSLLAPSTKNNIYGRSISALSSAKSLCVLSACETGVGEIKFGEGTMSLARAFLTGGTSTVINSLWAVNEQSTAQLMQNLYHEIRQTQRPAQALRQAKLAYLEAATEEAKHPYHWAGFICTSAMVTETVHSATWYYIGLGVLLIIVLLFYRKKTFVS